MTAMLDDVHSRNCSLDYVLLYWSFCKYFNALKEQFEVGLISLPVWKPELCLSAFPFQTTCHSLHYEFFV